MLRVLIIPLAVLAMLAGAMVWSGGAAERRADFSFINRGDINTLDLNQMSYVQDFRLTYGIREGLYGLDPTTYKPIPAGAASVDLSDDKKTWTFHLRKECRWSNGDPVTARDYAFSWRRMLEEPGEYTYLYYYMRDATRYKTAYAGGEQFAFTNVGIETPDDLTLRVTLENPVPYLLELVAFPPFYPRHERSMAKFRIFTDADVMDRFQECIDSVNGLDRSLTPTDLASKFAARVGLKKSLPIPDFVKWTEIATGFDTAQKTQTELLAALQVFAAMNPLEGVASHTDEASAAPEDGAPPDKFSPLPPAEKLRRMIDLGFIRHTYKKSYTLPPDVVTNGPYLLRRWDFKRRLLLDKSPQYWDRDNVKSNSIEMIVAETPQSQLLIYETGQVDWHSDVAGEQAAELRARGRTDLRSSPAFGTAFLTLLCTPTLPASIGGGPNPLSDVRVRQALAMSVDKTFIVRNLTRMDELPARTYLPPDGTLPAFTWTPGVFDVSGHGPYTFQQIQDLLRSENGLTGAGAGLPRDLERARQLLADAGYPGGKGFPVLPILYNTNNPTRRDICQVVKNQWKQALNIDIDIQGVEGKIFSRRISDKDYWIGTAAWYGDYPDVSTFTDKYLSTSLQNDSDWKNPEYDALCDKATREPDEGKRLALLSAAEHLIDTQIPVLPLYHYVNVTLSRDNVHGCKPNPRGITIFKNVWVDRQGGK